MTADELIEAVARIMYEDNGHNNWDTPVDGESVEVHELGKDDFRMWADAAIRVVVDAAVSVDLIRAIHTGATKAGCSKRLSIADLVEMARAVADAISALRPESGEGEK